MPTRKFCRFHPVRFEQFTRPRGAVEALESRTLWSAGALDPTFGTGGKVLLPGSPGSTQYLVNAVAVQADGKTLLAGTAGTYDTGSAGVFLLERLNVDGSPDASFGTGGVVTTSFPDLAVANAIAIQADGKIVLGGVDQSTLSGLYNGTAQFALARYNTDGSLDAGFGTGGKVLTSLPGREQIESLAIAPDGKIVAAGYGTYQDPAHASDVSYSTAAFMVARYTTGGVLDTSFNGTGYLTRQTDEFGPNEAGIPTIALATQPDGKVLVGGSFKIDPAVWRFNVDGSTDTSFGVAGMAWKALQYADLDNDYSSARVSQMLVQPDGKILVAGPYSTGTPQVRWMLARFNSDGRVDTGFGPASQPDGAGIVASAPLNAVGRTPPSGLGLQGDGKILIGGARDPGSPFVAYRFGADGTPDPTYQSADLGILGTFPTAGMVVMPDGRVIAAGNGPSGLNVLRFQGDAPPATTPVSPTSTTVGVPAGGLDPLFGALGRTVINDPTGVVLPDSPQHRFSAVAVQSDGKTVAAGSVGTRDNGGKGSFFLERFNTDGSLDTTFGSGGSVATDFGPISYATSIAIQPDGRIVLGGASEDSVSSPTSVMFALARYTAGGALDSTFGSGGKVTTDFTGNEQIDSLTLTSDGKIVAGGSYFSFPDIGFDIARYNPDGTPDGSFNGTGKLQHDLGKPPANSYPTSVAVQPDGKILVGSLSAGGAAVYRLDGDGSADDGFGTHGTAAVSGGADAAKVVVQPDGKIVVGVVDPPIGISETFQNVALFALARLKPDGSTDGTFGAGGVVSVTGNRSRVFEAGYVPLPYEPMGGLLIQGDGKILLVANQEVVDNFAGRSIGGAALIRRFTADGTADTSFQNDIDPAFNPLPYARGTTLTGAALSPDGKLLTSADVWSNNGASSLHWSGVGRYFTTAGSVTIDPPRQPGGNNGGGGNSGGTPGGPPLPAGQLAAGFVGALPGSVVGADKGSVTVRVTNSAKTAFGGPVTVSLYASADGALSGDDALIATLKIPALRLKAGQSKIVKLKFTYPATIAAGSYTVLAAVTQTNDGTAPAVAASAKAMTFETATADLGASFASGNTFGAKLGGRARAVLVITNNGSVTAAGPVKVTLYASADRAVDASDTILYGPVTRSVKIKPGKSLKVTLPFSVPSVAFANLLAQIVPATQPADASAADDLAVAAFSG